MNLKQNVILPLFKYIRDMLNAIGSDIRALSYFYEKKKQPKKPSKRGIKCISLNQK